MAKFLLARRLQPAVVAVLLITFISGISDARAAFHSPVLAHHLDAHEEDVPIALHNFAPTIVRLIAKFMREVDDIDGARQWLLNVHLTADMDPELLLPAAQELQVHLLISALDASQEDAASAMPATQDQPSMTVLTMENDGPDDNPAKRICITCLDPLKRFRGNKRLSCSICIICLDPLKRFRGNKRLPCRHVFHRNCIETWAQEAAVAPVLAREGNPTTKYSSATLYTHAFPGIVTLAGLRRDQRTLENEIEYGRPNIATPAAGGVCDDVGNETQCARTVRGQRPRAP
ncbi:unnamed protein product (mitochondrion) [Plasmodiophora brassicae]|uniref:RING-type domain-containing protein n=1 Tax=Plasmodiophora brassicae TaxID=37360 RepID=A0A3P3YGL8_PLABS|nr:unnamed protein product [Plasmodiophora brassicae]